MIQRKVFSLIITFGFIYFEIKRSNLKPIKIEVTKWYLKIYDSYIMKFIGNMILGFLISEGLLKIYDKLF